MKDFYVKVEAYIGQTNADVVPTDDLSLESIFLHEINFFIKAILLAMDNGF